MLFGNNNLFTLKISQLEQRNALNEAYRNSELHINASIKAIDVFLKAVDKKRKMKLCDVKMRETKNNKNI